MASQLAEDTAERLIGLIAEPGAGPVLVAATLWPEYWQQLTAQPRIPAEARTLLNDLGWSGH